MLNIPTNKSVHAMTVCIHDLRTTRYVCRPHLLRRAPNSLPTCIARSENSVIRHAAVAHLKQRTNAFIMQTFSILAAAVIATQSLPVTWKIIIYFGFVFKTPKLLMLARFYEFNCIEFLVCAHCAHGGAKRKTDVIWCRLTPTVVENSISICQQKN